MKNNIIFAGDFFSPNKKPKLGKDLKILFDDSKYKSVNFEAPIITDNFLPNPKAGPSIFHKEDVIPKIISLGFNYLNIANNHMYDFGRNGLEYTITKLNKFNIFGAGISQKEAYQIKFIKLNDIKIAMLSACEGEFGTLTDEFRQSGISWLFSPMLYEQIKKAREKSDFVILQAHAGVEEIDIPLPEWRSHYKYLIDLGVDIIIGHHPHVSQGWEKYKSATIFYSLGNFFFENLNSTSSTNGYIVNICFFKNKKYIIDVLPIVLTDNDTIEIGSLEMKAHLQKLCAKLNQPLYLKEVNKITLDLWKERYLTYYRVAMGGPIKKSPLSIISYIFRYIFNYRSVNLLLLLHNIRIESHRFLVQRALSLSCEKILE